MANVSDGLKPILLNLAEQVAVARELRTQLARHGRIFDGLLLGQVLGGQAPNTSQVTGQVLGSAGQSVNPQTASDLLDYLLGQ